MAPDHRLVASALERRWHETLTPGAAAQARLAPLAGQPRTRSEEPRHGFLPLGHDLATVWYHRAAPEALKKRLLRTVLQERMLYTTQEPPEHVLPLHWHGGVPTAVRVARHTVGQHGRATERDGLAVLRALSKVCRAWTMAATRHRWGSRTGTGKTWRAHSVACVRYQYRLPHVAQGSAWLTLPHAAQQWGVSVTVIKRCMAQGLFPARHVVPCAPWRIPRTDLALPAVQAVVQGVRPGRHPRSFPLRQPAGPGQAGAPAGAAPVVAAPGETHRRQLRSGER